VKLATCNVRNFPDMPPPKVAQDARAIAIHATLAGLQEIQPGEDTEVIMDGLHESARSWWMVGGQLETPIVGRGNRWDVKDHHVIPFHRPRNLPRPASAHGGVVSVVLESVKRPRLPAFAVVNTHLVANGLNGDRLPAMASRWHTEWAILQREVTRLRRLGLTVYVTGDLNAPRPPGLGISSRFLWLTPQGPADHVGQLRHSASVWMGHAQHESIPINSDHDLLVVSGPLRSA
jgi:hypothetical protein